MPPAIAQELSAFLADLDRVAIGERKGTLTVRSGKGGTYRQVPLNADVRRAIAAYPAVRPASAEERLFLGAGGRPLGPQGSRISSPNTPGAPAWRA